MRLVEDADGNQYALLKRSGSSSLVLDPDTGQRAYRPNHELIPVGDNIVEDPRAALIAVLVDADAAVPVRSILERTTLCESDLFAISRELEAGGVIEAVKVDGDRAWVLTDERRLGPDQS